MRARVLALALVSALSSCAAVQREAIPAIASANLVTASGQPAGSVALVASGSGYRLAGEVAGLPAGSHGFHLHAVGLCEAPFTTAGAHLNPALHEHGTLNPKGPHLGDLRNIAVTSDGRGRIDLPMDGNRSKLDADLFDADGTALIVHAAADDYRTDPSGNSGARIACGVMVRR